MTTEYGRGYTLCLLQFVFHEPMLDHDLAIFKGHLSDIWGERTESHAVELWANGSSDHLYDLICGGRVSPTMRGFANGIRDMALAAGHGFEFHGWTADDARFWLRIAHHLLSDVGDPQTLEEAEAIDRRLGLRPERGAGATCSKPMVPSKDGD